MTGTLIKALEALELILIDVDWQPNSITKPVISKATKELKAYIDTANRNLELKGALDDYGTYHNLMREFHIKAMYEAAQHLQDGVEK